MLLSKKKKFIFIHIYKNAGSSITSALLPKVSGNFTQLVCPLARKFGYILACDPKPYRSHISASEIVELISIEEFRSFFSFAIVRNPWDWQVSLYKYMLKNSDHHQHSFIKGLPSFSAYIKWRCENEIKLQKDFIYSARGELLVDFVGKYENIEADFHKICGKIGVKAVLPKLNVSNSKPYEYYYNDESIELVRTAFIQDIELFNYEF